MSYFRLLQLFTAATIFLPACDKINQFGLLSDASPITFSGVSKLEPTVDGKWELSWSPAEYSEPVRYEVYMASKPVDTSLTTAKGADQESIVAAEQYDLAKSTVTAAGVNPAVEGELLKTLNSIERSYTIDRTLLPGNTYFFFVRARADDQTTDLNDTVLVLEMKKNLIIDPSAGYPGCTSAAETESVAPGISTTANYSATVEFTFPTDVERVAIYRDGVQIAVVNDPRQLTYVDNGLEPAVSYEYACEAQWKESKVIGPNRPKVKISNPLLQNSTYEGCLTATPNVNGTIVVTFAFPPGAEKVNVYRNEQVTYTSYSKTDTTFTEQSLASHSVHRFRCEASRADKRLIGSSVLTVTIPDPVDSLANFQGCLSAIVLSSSDISVNYEFPTAFARMKVLRNGLPIFVTTDRTSSVTVDTGLTEGVTYTYSCEGETAAGATKTGSTFVSVRTLSSNPPSFSGIISATLATPASLKSASLLWGATSGVPVGTFKVYVNPGTTVDWGAPPFATATPGTLTKSVSSLGDELNYSFGIRACSADNNCESNTVIRTVTLPDSGAPTTPGATSVAIVNGAAVVTAPWSPSDGALKYRRVYLKTGPNPGTEVTTYALAKTVEVTNIYDPATEITINNLSQNTQYNFMVRDEDPSHNVSSNLSVASVSTGDLTAPVFTGLSTLSQVSGAAGETSLDVGFAAIVKEADNAVSGASHYLFYVKSSGGNACTDGTLVATVSTSPYTSGVSYVYRIGGLTPRTNYSVCVKAKDTATNISSTTSYLSKYTLDTTAPTFGGLDVASYSNASSRFTLSWAASSSADISSYRIKIWKATPTPAAGDITTFNKAHSSNSAGWVFSSSDYAFISGETLYFLVDACDDADAVPGGVKNCTTLATASAKSISLPDIEAPASFAGIKSAANLTTPSEGEIGVYWFAPADWTDYSGFKVYSVDGSGNLTQLKDCQCSGNNCPDHLDHCTLTGLTPYKNYILHVRAYDAAGNITQLSTSSLVSTKRTTDTTPPTLYSNLTATLASGAVAVNFIAATENQSSEGTITYKIYRKASSIFATPTNPSADGSLLSTQTTTSYSDTTVTDGLTYYYAVCALDSSNNRTCDGVVPSVTVTDHTPPVITAFTSNKTADSKEWTLSWTMSDNATPLGSLRVFIYRSVTMATSTATASDDYAENSVTHEAAGPLIGATSFTHQVGPANQDRFVNYLLRIEDQEGNASTAALTVQSNNAVTLTSVNRNTGPTAGGKWVQILGTGISPNADIKFGGEFGNSCTNMIVVEPGIRVLCKTPTGSNGVVDVAIVNPLASGIALLTGAYTYGTTNICDTNAGQTGSPFASANNGLSAGAAFQICTATQLANVSSQATGKYYSLEDNIDLQGVSMAPLTNVGGSFSGTFEGNDHVVLNYSYSPSSFTDKIGLFGSVTGGTIKNLGVANVAFGGSAQLWVGGIIGKLEVNSGTFSGLWSTGSIVGTDILGGLIGGTDTSSGYTISNSFSTASVTNSGQGTVSNSSLTAMGGLVGRSGASVINGSYATGNVTSSLTSVNAGGLVGRTVSALAITDSYASGNVNTTNIGGGLVGRSGSTLSNTTWLRVHATGNVTCTSNCAGLVAYGSPSITDSFYSGTITAGGTNAAFGTGAIVGTLSTSGSPAPGYSGTLTRVYANASIVGSSTTTVPAGGLIGIADGATVIDSYFTGSLSGGYVGGLIGKVIGGTVTITRSYANASPILEAATSGTPAMGGLVGYIEPTIAAARVDISKSYAEGLLFNSNSGTLIGGLIGQGGIPTSPSTITDSYSIATLNSSQAITFGGLVAAGTASNIAITRSFYAGAVTNGGSATTGIATAIMTPSCTDLYFDSTKAGTSTSGCTSGATAKTTALMQASSTFTNFDFTPTTGVWKMPATTGYPVLMWQP